jgi:vitamin B12 transporter
MILNLIRIAEAAAGQAGMSGFPFRRIRWTSGWRGRGLALMAGIVAATGARAETLPETELAPFAVETSLGLHDEPALGLAMPVTSLRFAPGVDLQSRGYAELQSDVTVRGSTFEQTGVLLGTVPLFDPQTGHYAAELPFAGEMLRPARLLVGVDNARLGFNASVGSLAFDWAPVEARGRAVVGVGTEALRFAEYYQGFVFGPSGWAADLSAGHGQGDGTIDGGDFRVWRGAARLQHRAPGRQTDLALGWLDKFYGWPGLYTGFASLLETDDYQNLVLTANHRQVLDGGGFWALGAAYREMDDDYYFNRRTPPAERTSTFQHRTRVATVAGEGHWVWSESLALRGRGVVLADELVRSTSLTTGDAATGNDFTARRYAQAVVTGEFTWEGGEGGRHRLEAGLLATTTDRDEGRVSPLLRWEQAAPAGNGERAFFAQFSETSQVPGYTALRSAPSGLFGGNANLGRELTRVAEVGVQWDGSRWFLRASAFFRRDDDLVDWTFNAAAPNARQANAMELETAGLELQAVHRPEWGELRLAYAWLDKSADYGAASVDASFYALNTPVHRLTGGLAWRPREGLELAAEGEYRVAEENPRRTSGKEATRISLALRWRPSGASGLEWNLLVDNLLDDDFEEFPGTPGVGRHASLRAIHRW